MTLEAHPGVVSDVAIVANVKAATSILKRASALRLTSRSQHSTRHLRFIYCRTRRLQAVRGAGPASTQPEPKGIGERAELERHAAACRRAAASERLSHAAMPLGIAAARAGGGAIRTWDCTSTPYDLQWRVTCRPR